MRDDLLDAQACVDWAVSQINALRKLLIAWDEERPYRVVAEPHPEPGKKLLRLTDVAPVHPLINAQVGAMINSIRCSLDVLVNGLAKRAGYEGPEDSRFPVCRTREDFYVGKHAGRKAIKRLLPDDQIIIEQLEPWSGGKTPLLIALHNLDVTRKHRRLVAVSVRPQFAMFIDTGRGRRISFDHIPNVPFENNAQLAVVGMETQEDKTELSLTVSLNESGPLAGQDIMLVIKDLVRTASAIIGKFDT
jgi:hypothetical protein